MIAGPSVARVIAALHDARLAEKAQTAFYRGLALKAEWAGDGKAAERLNGLLADEQHHFSRLSARLLELGETFADPPQDSPTVDLETWETVARPRERAEIQRYERILALDLDSRTRRLIEEFLVAERSHESELGGKWMEA